MVAAKHLRTGCVKMIAQAAVLCSRQHKRGKAGALHVLRLRLHRKRDLGRRHEGSKRKLMIKSQQIRCFALSEAIHNVLSLPQIISKVDAALHRVNAMSWPKIPAESGSPRGVEVVFVHVS